MKNIKKLVFIFAASFCLSACDFAGTKNDNNEEYKENNKNDDGGKNNDGGNNEGNVLDSETIGKNCKAYVMNLAKTTGVYFERSYLGDYYKIGMCKDGCIFGAVDGGEETIYQFVNDEVYLFQISDETTTRYKYPLDKDSVLENMYSYANSSNLGANQNRDDAVNDGKATYAGVEVTKYHAREDIIDGVYHDYTWYVSTQGSLTLYSKSVIVAEGESTEITFSTEKFEQSWQVSIPTDYVDGGSFGD